MMSFEEFCEAVIDDAHECLEAFSREQVVKYFKEENQDAYRRTYEEAKKNFEGGDKNAFSKVISSLGYCLQLCFEP